jgi:carbonic anhydrase
MPSYTLSSKVNQAHTEVLVVHCSDHRFQAGHYEFLNLSLNLGENYDLLVLPGGAQALSLLEYLPKFAWAGWKWFRFLVDAHGLKRIILIAHQDCGWYKSLPQFLHSMADPRAKQEGDLLRIREVLLKENRELSVELYYAAFDPALQDRIVMEAIST